MKADQGIRSRESKVLVLYKVMKKNRRHIRQRIIIG